MLSARSRTTICSPCAATAVKVDRATPPIPAPPRAGSNPSRAALRPRGVTDTVEPPLNGGDDDRPAN